MKGKKNKKTADTKVEIKEKINSEELEKEEREERIGRNGRDLEKETTE